MFTFCVLKSTPRNVSLPVEFIFYFCLQLFVINSPTMFTGLISLFSFWNEYVCLRRLASAQFFYHNLTWRVNRGKSSTSSHRSVLSLGTFQMKSVDSFRNFLFCFVLASIQQFFIFSLNGFISV